MNKWSENSLAQRATSHPKLQQGFDTVLQIHDCAWVWGHRGEAQQNQMFANGVSKKQWPDSTHNELPSIGADIIPYVRGIGAIVGNKEEDLKYFYHFAGIVRAVFITLDTPIRWGGDWDGDFNMDDQSFNDLYHYELIK